MSDLPTVKLNTARRGDTWAGLGSVTVKVDGAPLDLTGAKIEMQLRRTPRHAKVMLEWSTLYETIEFVDALNGVFRVLSRKMDVPAGSYHWDIELTLASGRVLTIAAGTWSIGQDVTR